jgi:hypothetical protein
MADIKSVRRRLRVGITGRDKSDFARSFKTGPIRKDGLPQKLPEKDWRAMVKHPRLGRVDTTHRQIEHS